MELTAIDRNRAEELYKEVQMGRCRGRLYDPNL